MEPVDILQESRQAELAASYHYTNMAHQADYTSVHSWMHPSQGDRSRVNAPGCSLNLQKPYIRLADHLSVLGVAYLWPLSSHLSYLPISLFSFHPSASVVAASCHELRGTSKWASQLCWLYLLLVYLLWLATHKLVDPLKTGLMPGGRLHVAPGMWCTFKKELNAGS